MFSGGLRKRASDVELLIQEYRRSIVMNGVYLVQRMAAKAMQRIEKVSMRDNLEADVLSIHNVPVSGCTQFNRQAGKKGKDGTLENIAFTDAIWPPALWW